MAVPVLALLKLAPGVIKLLQTIADHAEQEGLMDAGAAKEFRGAVTNMDRRVADALAASAGLSHDADSVRDDVNNRDQG